MPPQNDLIFQLVLVILGAVLGELFKNLISVLKNTIRFRKGPDIRGKWLSIYRPDFRHNTAWIREEIEIKLRFGRIQMRNLNHPTDDDYIVNARVIDKTYLIGYWKSIKPGANASGTIMMTISPLGDLMYGYFTGLGDTGERTYCSWVMARDEQDIERGVELARKLSLGFSKSPSGILAAPNKGTSPTTPGTVA